MITHSSTQNIYTKVISMFFVIVLLVPSLFFISTNKAHAVAVQVTSDSSTTNIKTMVENTLQTIESSLQTGFQSRQDFKDFVLDPAAFYLAELALESITASIVNWINSGFQGSPAFVTDLEGFLLDVADQAAGEFIYGSELGFLCSPFELDVRIALAVQYQEQRDYRPMCTLSDVVANTQGFLDGAFSEGGWAGWFELTQNPVNNPTGALLSAQAELDARIVDAQGREITTLGFGSGFFSFKICEEVETDGAVKLKCDIATPGSTIQNALDEGISVGGKKLIIADEFQEIVSALFAQLAQQAITGINGLLGLGSSSYTDYSYGASGQSSYLDALREPDPARDNVLFEDTLIDQIIYQEDYLDLQFEIIERINAVERRYNSAKSQYAGCFSVRFPSSLYAERADAQAEISFTNPLIEIITAIYDAYVAAPTVDEQIKIADQYNELARQGILFTATDVAKVDLFIEFDLIPDIEDLDDDIDRDIQRCQSQP